MDRNSVLIGAVFLVLSALFLGSLLFLLVLVMAVLGVLFLLDGLRVFNLSNRTAGSGDKPTQLTTLDLKLLEMISQNKSQAEAGAATGVSPTIIAEKIAALESAGYLSNNHLTEKGFDTLRSAN